MHLSCRLREIRGKRPLRDVAALAGVHRGVLSQIETGRLLPREEQIAGIEEAYGSPLHTWYPPEVLAVLNREFAAAEVAA